MTEDTGFFRSLRGLATDWVQEKRKSLQTEPLTDVDSAGGKGAYSFQGQELSFDDLREIKDMRDSGGQVAALMQSKALLNFGEGAEITVEDNEDTAQTIQGTEMTLKEWLELRFPELDLTVLDLGKDALWYPYAVGEHRENRAGQYKEFLPAEPYTILPETDNKGEIVRWHQRTQTQGGYKTKVLQPDEIEAIVLNKSCARDKTGISEVLRNKEEIQAFRENEQAIQQAIELHGFPQRHVRVGREDGAPVRDDELRRVRNIFDPRNTDANTAYFTGQDVDVSTIEAENFDYQAVHEMSTRKLTTALGMPLEAGNVGSDGLGSGKPAELRFSMLKLQIKANQRAFATQFVEQVLRPVVRDYSPFSHTAKISLEIDDPLEDIGDMADVINKVGEYLTNAEIRRKLDLPEPEDEEIAEGYRSPADIEAPEDEQTNPLFGGAVEDKIEQKLDNRELADVPDKYTEGTGLSEDDFVPNESILDVIEPTMEFIDEHGLPNPDNQEEGAARINQLHDHITDNEPLAPAFWQEISNFHARHRAQGNDECDESSLPEQAEEVDFDECHFDAGWFSDRTWGGDPAKEQADRIVEAIESTEGVQLSKPVPEHWQAGDTDFSHRCLGGPTERDKEHLPEWDQSLLSMQQAVTQPDMAGDKHLVSVTDNTTPQFVLDRIRDALLQGNIFTEIESIAASDRDQLREYMLETLTDERGWTLDGLTDQLQQIDGLENRDDAERVARTETTSILNNSREIAYQEQGKTDNRFYWTGALDDRTTDTCAYLQNGFDADLENPGAFSGLRRPDGTDPFEGGEPMPLEELQEHIKEVAQADPELNTQPRQWTPHINCRSTFVLEPDAGI
ncbi:hypothetical protein OSG_eHP1_00005 [environmental Halophage eHP-1]|nr:hypothetical protein OSG_eHP1_00005 [environmental Halophage eHP-1]